MDVKRWRIPQTWEERLDHDAPAPSFRSVLMDLRIVVGCRVLGHALHVRDKPNLWGQTVTDCFRCTRAWIVG